MSYRHDLTFVEESTIDNRSWAFFVLFLQVKSKRKIPVNQVAEVDFGHFSKKSDSQCADEGIEGTGTGSCATLFHIDK